MIIVLLYRCVVFISCRRRRRRRRRSSSRRLFVVSSFGERQFFALVKEFVWTVNFVLDVAFAVACV